MFIIDLDQVDWSKCPTEVLDMARIEDVKAFLKKQPSFIGVTLTNSDNPKIRMAATTTAMNLSQALASMYPLMLEYVNEKRGDAKK